MKLDVPQVGPHERNANFNPFWQLFLLVMMTTTTKMMIVIMMPVDLVL